jgi:hypothetical protein
MIFEETVHEDDGLAHAGGHGTERFLACRPQTQIKLFEARFSAASVCAGASSSRRSALPSLCQVWDPLRLTGITRDAIL